MRKFLKVGKFKVISHFLVSEIDLDFDLQDRHKKVMRDHFTFLGMFVSIFNKQNKYVLIVPPSKLF